MQTELETVRNILNKSVRDEAEIISHDTKNGTNHANTFLEYIKSDKDFRLKFIFLRLKESSWKKRYATLSLSAIRIKER